MTEQNITTAPEPETPLQDGNYYHVQESMRNGSLNLFVILANPRTSSTLLELAILQNEFINAHSHEPFQKSNYPGGIDAGYGQILDSENNAANSGESVNLVIKEIGRCLMVNDEYRRFLDLVDAPPILLIRNPLLSTESKIRAVLKSLQSSRSRNLNNILAGINTHENEEPLNSTGEDATDKETRKTLLDTFATRNGYSDWETMLTQSFSAHDYKSFADLLGEPSIFKLEPPAIHELAKYLREANKKYIVVDSTDLRMDPEGILSALCEKWGISYSPRMLNWGKEGDQINTGQTDMNNWYSRVGNSMGVDEPTEISPSIEDFPEFIADYLVKVEIPAYYNLFKDGSRIKPSPDSISKPLLVDVNLDQLRRLNSHRANIVDYHIIFSRHEDQTLPQTDVTISAIDPLYSYLSSHDD